VSIPRGPPGHERRLKPAAKNHVHFVGRDSRPQVSVQKLSLNAIGSIFFCPFSPFEDSLYPLNALAQDPPDPVKNKTQETI
jgi:hypothetical protein